MARSNGRLASSFHLRGKTENTRGIEGGSRDGDGERRTRRTSVFNLYKYEPYRAVNSSCFLLALLDAYSPLALRAATFVRAISRRVFVRRGRPYIDFVIAPRARRAISRDLTYALRSSFLRGFLRKSTNLPLLQPGLAEEPRFRPQSGNRKVSSLMILRFSSSAHSSLVPRFAGATRGRLSVKWRLQSLRRLNSCINNISFERRTYTYVLIVYCSET